ncbi:MAG: hypothetical protein L6406_03815 [Desulfobacterales bacterium]|nr:hypothetical protein [Desulfobacterales bacterium]
MKDKIFCINEAENLYRANPSRSKFQTRSIRHDSVKNKNMKTGVKENWQAVYRQLSNEIKVRHYCKFSLNQGYIKKIPLNPPLQKGEAFGIPGFIEMLRIVHLKP